MLVSDRYIKYGNRGSKNPNAKLTEDQVRNIKSRLKDGDRRNTIAEELGVSAAAVKSIDLGRTWGWLKI